jgi:hypothetical protein
VCHRWCELVGLKSTSSRRGAFGLLHRGALKKITQLSMGLPSLQSRWFEHLLEEDCCSGDILDCPREERRMTVIVVVADLVVDFVSSSLSHATIIVVLEFLLECYTVVPVTVAPPRASFQALGVAPARAMLALEVMAWLHVQRLRHRARCVRPHFHWGFLRGLPHRT